MTVWSSQGILSRFEAEAVANRSAGEGSGGSSELKSASNDRKIRRIEALMWGTEADDKSLAMASGGLLFSLEIYYVIQRRILRLKYRPEAEMP